jgi:hypothetical protein
MLIHVLPNALSAQRSAWDDVPAATVAPGYLGMKEIVHHLADPSRQYPAHLKPPSNFQS